MPNIQVVFLGAKPVGYACFRHLLEKQEELGYQVIGYLSNERREFGNDYSFAELADQYQVPKISSLEELPRCHILLSVQYHKILQPQHLKMAKTIAVNLHMAPLPEYRGSNQFSFALVDNKKQFGTSIHVMDAQIDHGAILFQSRFPIPENCWVDELYRITVEASIHLFQDSLPKLIKGKYRKRRQKKFEKRLGTSLHFKHEIEQLKQIDLNWETEQMDRHIRATFMPGFEPPYCIINGKKQYFGRVD